MKVPSLVMSGVVAVMLLLAQGTLAEAAEITILSSAVSRSAVSELGPLFERKADHKVVIQFANNPIVKKQVEEGARFDVVIIEPDMLDDLIRQGKVAAGTRVDLARVGMALLAPAGAPKPDMSTIDAFKGALRNASSIGYVADGHSGTVFLRTLDRIGLAEELKPKLKPLIGRPCAVAVPNREVGMRGAYQHTSRWS